jgi:hypothetical protein
MSDDGIATPQTLLSGTFPWTLRSDVICALWLLLTMSQLLNGWESVYPWRLHLQRDKPQFEPWATRMHEGQPVGSTH